jgi:hypothetical protein
MHLNDDVIYRCPWFGLLHQLHAGRSRSLVRYNDSSHANCLLSNCWFEVVAGVEGFSSLHAVDHRFDTSLDDLDVSCLVMPARLLLRFLRIAVQRTQLL